MYKYRTAAFADYVFSDENQKTCLIGMFDRLHPKPGQVAATLGGNFYIELIELVEGEYKFEFELRSKDDVNVKVRLADVQFGYTNDDKSGILKIFLKMIPSPNTSLALGRYDVYFVVNGEEQSVMEFVVESK